MRVIVNQVAYELPNESVITDALSLIEAKPPYAVAVNLQFVPKTKHGEYLFHVTCHLVLWLGVGTQT